MKQKFYLFAALLAMTTAANAQIQTEGKETKDWPLILPKEFSYDNNNVYIVTKDDENFGQSDAKCVLTIYNDDIKKVHSFEIPNFVGYTRVEYYERKNVPVIASQNEYELYGPFSNKEEALEWIKKELSEASDGINVDGDNIYPLKDYCYYQYETLGYTYPSNYWRWDSKNNYLYEVRLYYNASYTGDWELIEERISDYSDETFDWHYYYDYDNYGGNHTYIYLTQTLFNADDKYEYIRRNYEESTYTYNEIDQDDDGEIDYKVISYGYQMKSFSIVQEDGTVLQTIPGTSTPDLMQINGKRYLVVENEEENANGGYVYTYTYYLIDSKSNQIKRMDVEMSMSVRPSVTDRNGQVTVELGEQSDAKEIWVVNGAGQTVKRIPVEKGQKQVVFSANGLNKGVNVVHASGRNAQASRKIVVK